MGSDTPLISCIMPTRNRPHFVRRALHYFQSQDYPNKELIIVDCSDWSDYDLNSYRAGLHYVHVSRSLSIGMMRNIACSLAHGEIICHMDDDDVYRPHRLSKQVQYLLNHSSIGMTGLRTGALVD